jgi:hypothetical protein
MRYKISPGGGLTSVTLYQKEGNLIGVELTYNRAIANTEIYILTGLDPISDQYLEQAYPIDQVLRVDSDYLESLKNNFW